MRARLARPGWCCNTAMSSSSTSARCCRWPWLRCNPIGFYFYTLGLTRQPESVLQLPSYALGFVDVDVDESENHSLKSKSDICLLPISPPLPPMRQLDTLT